ncbi:MAG: hypothetical protein R6U86_10490 [Bacteroidales bacterium]
MKTKIIITAAFIVLGTFAQAAAPKRTLTVYDTFGRALTMPVKTEEAAETLPFDQEQMISSEQKRQSAQVFDISKMSRPESEVNDIPGELRHIIHQDHYNQKTQ